MKQTTCFHCGDNCTVDHIVYNEKDFCCNGCKTVCEILIQTHGQGLAVASKAFGISKEDFVSMFLLSNQFRNTGRLVDSQAMAKAVTYYDRVEPSVALQIIRNSSVH